MNQWAYQGILEILEETYCQQGWQIPAAVIEYQCQILTEMVEQPDWRPQPSYAERFMQIRNRREAQNLGNVCWFTRAVFPELMQRRGISARYYTDLGQSCYQRALQDTVVPTVKIMLDHFEFLAEAAHTAIRYNQQFREMWDL